MKPIESKDKTRELSYLISKVFEALIKEDIPKAEGLYHKINKFRKHLGQEKLGVLDHQIKRLEKEIKICKKKVKAGNIKETATKIAPVVVGLLIVLVYLFLEPRITGLYGAENSASLSSIPDLYLEVGREFTFRVYPDDQSMENIAFSDDTRLFSISKDGLLKFTPTEEMKGVHYVAIIARGPNDWFDLEIVKFVIGNKEFIEEQASIESKVSEEIAIETETKVKEEPIDVIVEEINETAINVTEPTNGTIEELKNETIDPVNLTIELNETMVNQSFAVNSSDLEYERIIVEDITAIINQTINENLNLTDQTD